jgi:two-component system sensor histidine kinase SaeS
LIELTNVLVEASETEDIYYGYKKKYFDMREVVMKALDRVQPITEKRKISLLTDIAPKISLVAGDPNRIASAIDVMLENAMIYSNEGGEVAVSLHEKDKNVIFTVKDSGIGIKPEDQKHIFTRFYRTYAAKVADTEGMGLGLAMAKSIIDKHRGEIGVRSEGSGQGSTFWFSIPL